MIMVVSMVMDMLEFNVVFGVKKKVAFLNSLSKF